MRFSTIYTTAALLCSAVSAIPIEMRTGGGQSGDQYGDVGQWGGDDSQQGSSSQQSGWGGDSSQQHGGQQSQGSSWDQSQSHDGESNQGHDKNNNEGDNGKNGYDQSSSAAHTSTTEEAKTTEHAMTSEAKTTEHAMTSEAKTTEHAMTSEAKTTEHAMTSEAKTTEHATSSQAQTTEHATTTEEAKTTEHAMTTEAKSTEHAMTTAAATTQAWTSEAAKTTESAMQHGSGSTTWGYDGCVESCKSTWAMSSATTWSEAAKSTESAMGTMPPPTATTSHAGNSTAASGTTHTVVVAPSQGVLRYVPFSVNASVGDTVLFMWGANNHTVTKGSQLEPCNKTSDALFASGTHDKDFTFTQVVNSTEPTFFYCATTGHCQKGMFGIINPPNALGTASTSVAAMMSSMSQTDKDVEAYAAYTDTQTAGTAAANWGTNMDMAGMPDWAMAPALENVMYTRNFLAANPELMKEDGSIDMSSMATTPLMVPPDMKVALAQSGSASSSAPSGPAATQGAGSGSSSSSGSTGTTSASTTGTSGTSSEAQAAGAISGAGSVVASKFAVGAITVLATLALL
ncbi:hypothetical protein CYLTODRAFT_427166 [Cylindrobasidium torrendii FP15055 ss-10]|uniref:Phytocyanin domain-containing protein n=1 Tax=Cylindrobasidium torrendii FP15055 ss-10 TaxID=1314674 RepID=A0A0D7AXT9_9AGAR|nr:hypothetical protein CYLTODRAFT_427166 [Cylindrobasidium torrendii FP15055 ss-10]